MSSRHSVFMLIVFIMSVFVVCITLDILSRVISMSLFFTVLFWYLFNGRHLRPTSQTSRLIGCRNKPLRKIKPSVSSCCEVNSVRQVESEALEPPSISNGSISSPAAELLFVSQCRVFLSGAAELLDQGRGSTGGPPTTKRRTGLIAADDTRRRFVRVRNENVGGQQKSCLDFWSALYWVVAL